MGAVLFHAFPLGCQTAHPLSSWTSSCFFYLTCQIHLLIIYKFLAFYLHGLILVLTFVTSLMPMDVNLSDRDACAYRDKQPHLLVGFVFHAFPLGCQTAHPLSSWTSSCLFYLVCQIILLIIDIFFAVYLHGLYNVLIFATVKVLRGFGHSSYRKVAGFLCSSIWWE